MNWLKRINLGKSKVTHTLMQFGQEEHVSPISIAFFAKLNLIDSFR